MRRKVSAARAEVEVCVPKVTDISGNLALIVVLLMFATGAVLTYLGKASAESVMYGAMTGMFALLQLREKR